jgi:hypothetical protein
MNTHIFMLLFFVLVVLFPLAAAVVGPPPPPPSAWVPTWPATYAMNESTIAMACNENGFVPADYTKNIAIVDFDWSSSKAVWAKDKPMDAEEKLLEQATLTKASSPNTKIFVYRNSIKALSWFSSVRKILSDPAYAVWFLPFGRNVTAHVPRCDTNYNPPLCSDLYHDQEQTPGYPSGDGVCAAPACDSGTVPTGEYLFDHRAANVSVGGITFLQWFIHQYIMNPTGGGSDLVSGFYVSATHLALLCVGGVHAPPLGGYF